MSPARLPAGSALPTTQEAALKRRCDSARRNHQRRAARAGARLGYTARHLVELARAAVLCHWCRMPTDFGSLVFDHATPTDRGGSWGLENLVCSCDRCNRIKSVLDGPEFVALLAFLKTLGPVAEADVRRRLLAGGKVYRGGGRVQSRGRRP